MSKSQPELKCGVYALLLMCAIALIYHYTGHKVIKALCALVGWGSLLAYAGLFWRKASGQFVGVFAVVLLTYMPISLTARMTAGDSFWYIPTAMSILSEGNCELSEFKPYIDELSPVKLSVKPMEGDYRLKVIEGKIYNFYPTTTSIAYLPLVLPLNWWYENEAQPIRRALLIAPMVAKTVAALSAALLFLVVRRQKASVTLALLLTGIFAFATPQLSNHAGGIWNHNIAGFLLLLVLYALSGSSTRGALAMIPLSYACTMRPELAMIAGVLGLWVLMARPDIRMRFVLLGVVCVAVYFAYVTLVFGGWPPPFMSDKSGLHGFSFYSFLGLWFSPSRGLFLYTPVFLFSLWGMLRLCTVKPRNSLLIAVSLALLAHTLFISLWPMWWGGWSFGPRFYAVVSGLWVLLLLPALQGIQALPSRVLAVIVRVAFIFALTWSLGVHWIGVTQIAVHHWNSVPNNIDHNPERLWDWQDSQLRRIGKSQPNQEK